MKKNIIFDTSRLLAVTQSHANSRAGPSHAYNFEVSKVQVFEMEPASSVLRFGVLIENESCKDTSSAN